MIKPKKLKLTVPTIAQARELDINALGKFHQELGANKMWDKMETYYKQDIKELKEKHRKELSILLDRLERVNLDMNVVICDCGEPYKDTDPHIELKDIIQELAGAIHQAQGDK